MTFQGPLVGGALRGQMTMPASDPSRSVRCGVGCAVQCML